MLIGMKLYIPSLIILATLAGCSHEDVEHTKQKAKEAEQEIKKEVDQAGKEIKKKAEEASQEIKKEVDQIKQGAKRKDTRR